MDLKTQFDVGQEVWYMYGNMPRCAVIEEIRVVIDTQKSKVQYVIYGNTYDSDRVFDTADYLTIKYLEDVKNARMKKQHQTSKPTD